MKDILITKNLEKDVWEKRLVLSEFKLKLDSSSSSSNYFAIIEIVGLVIGVSYEENSVYPKVKTIDSINGLFVGVDNCLTMVDLIQKRMLSRILLQSLFIDVIETKEGILIIEEIGVGLYDMNFNEKWFLCTDLIEECIVENDVITILTDSGRTKISLSTGEI